MNTNGGMDWYAKHRPTRVADVVGQPAAVATVAGWRNKLPRVVMFTGPAGTGKTTLARVVLADAGCAPHDLNEINTATASPLDMARDIENTMTLAPMGGRIRGYVLDEFQSLSRARFAQEAFLRVFEDDRTPDVKFVVCTTDPRKILPAIQSRCTKVALGPVPDADLTALVKKVAKAERVPDLTDAVVTKIVAAAGGSARTALVELQKVAGIDGEEARLAAVQRVGEELAANKLIGALMPFKGEPRWSDVCKVLEAIEGEEPESVRQMVLAVARKVILRNGPDALRAVNIVNTFFDPLYDRNSGHAILTMWCWRVVHGEG